MQRKIIAASIVGAACLGAGALTMSATASSRTTAPAAISAQVTPEPSDTSAAIPADNRPEPGTRLTETLAPLVADGTLTQAQADAVVAALLEARPDRGPGGEGRPGHGRPGQSLDAAATVLGITPADLATQLRDGSTLAEIATAQGVEVTAVVDALVVEATQRLTQGVTDGKITQEQADAKLVLLEDRITKLVNEGGPRGGHGGPGSGRGHGPEGGAGDTDQQEVPVTTAG